MEANEHAGREGCMHESRSTHLHACLSEDVKQASRHDAGHLLKQKNVEQVLRLPCESLVPTMPACLPPPVKPILPLRTPTFEGRA